MEPATGHCVHQCILAAAFKKENFLLYVHDLLHQMPDFACRLLMHRKFTAIWQEFAPEERFLFIHIPKNAGTYISHSLYGRFLNHYPLKLYQVDNPQRLQRMRSFAVMRDPALRFMSGIHHHLYGEDLSIPDYSLRKVMLAISDDPFVIARSFFTDSMLRFRMRSSLHFVPQYLWIVYKDQIAVDLLYGLAPDRKYVENLVDLRLANVSSRMVEKASIPSDLLGLIEQYYDKDNTLYRAIPASRILQDASELTRARLESESLSDQRRNV